MSALPELQAAISGALRNNGASGLWALFREPQMVAERRFAAYRRNVIGNWRSALGSSYPVVVQLLGPSRFRELADQYIVTHSSGSGDLNAYGSELASLIDASSLRDELPYLADIARLEWALLVAYGAADAPDFDFAALASVPVDVQAELQLQVWPAAVVLVSLWPLVDIWRAHQSAPDQRDLALAAIDPLPSSEPRYALTARSEGNVFAVALSAGEAAFLRALQARLALVEAIATALATDAAFNPGTTLQRLVALRVLTGFQENNNE